MLERTYTFGFAVRAVPASGVAFSASTSRWQLGSLALVHTVHDRGDGRRGPAEIAANEPDLLGLLYMRHGTIGLDFEGKPVVLRPGELVMWDTARRGGFTTFGRVDNQTLVIPRERLATVAPGYEAMFGRPFRSDHPAARLMGSFLGSLMPVVSSLDVAARDAVADAALDIARAVLTTRDDPQPRQQTAARLLAVRLYIDANLSNPGLSPATIAKANAISLRTLHRLFEPTHDSVSAVHSRAQAQPLPRRSASRHGRVSHHDRLPMGLSQPVVLQPPVPRAVRRLCARAANRRTRARAPAEVTAARRSARSTVRDTRMSVGSTPATPDT